MYHYVHETYLSKPKGVKKVKCYIIIIIIFPTRRPAVNVNINFNVLWYVLCVRFGMLTAQDVECSLDISTVLIVIVQRSQTHCVVNILLKVFLVSGLRMINGQWLGLYCSFFLTRWRYRYILQLISFVTPSLVKSCPVTSCGSYQYLLPIFNKHFFSFITKNR